MTQAPIIVLIRPQMGENIGAVARAMSNFGVSELRIVAPRDGWPNDAATAMAAHAAPIVEAAQIYDTIEGALADIQVAYATTARPRDMAKRVVSPQEAMAEMTQFSSPLEGRGDSKAAIVFGPERTGLTNEDLALCEAIITIPTAENASLNIAQSAVVVLYEWFKQRDDDRLPITDDAQLATLADYEQFFKRLEARLEDTDFFKVDEKKPAMMLNIKNMFLRGRYSEQELRTLHGIIRALSEKK